MERDMGGRAIFPTMNAMRMLLTELPAMAGRL